MPYPAVLRVAVPAPLHQTFDYLPPSGVELQQLLPGVRLRVPFGRGERCGVLLEICDSASVARRRLKPALALLDSEPLFSAVDLDLLRWASRYYQHPLGEVIANALPLRLRKGEPLLEVRITRWSLTAGGALQDPTRLSRAPRQAALLRQLQAAGGTLEQRALIQAGGTPAVLRTLEEKGWLSRSRELPQAVAPAAVAGPPALSDEQSAAVEQVVLDRFGSYLLDGITGSGKTEVYLALMEQVLAVGRQVLILVPEIGLTPQLVARLQRRLARPLVLLHSGLSAGEREQAWHLARQGWAGVVLGTRSALFTPLPALGLIVVDEEHDLSFKQQDGFRYHARDLAVIRARQVDCPVVLGSATPSLESLQNVAAGRYQPLLLRQRAGGAQPARLDLIDIRSLRLQGGLSPYLIERVAETLARGEQVLLFLNRRGFAPMVTCHACGWIAQCRRCDARLTLHAGSQRLWCHHCGAQQPLMESCPECQSTEVRLLGQGTERLEQTLLERFPDYPPVRIDRDSTRRKGRLQQLLGEIKAGRHALLVGTQMLAKGHHFPDVTLVGILDVDQGLFGVDYRAAERMAQQILQVAGRAGRAEKPGQVLIQTRHPDHPLMQRLVREGYSEFAREALLEREAAQLPPFGFQLLLRAEATRRDAPLEFLEAAAELAAQLGSDDIQRWGPVPAPMERRAGRFRAHLLLQADQRPLLQRLLPIWVPRLAKLPSARRVRWSVDVDPQELI